MARLFLDPSAFENGFARISGADHLHLTRVLRARPGETVELLDGAGNAFLATLVTIGKSVSEARIEGPIEFVREPAVPVFVAQALARGDKLEQVIQHGTEIGAVRFTPLMTDRCMVELSAGRAPDRLARWRSVAKGAAEQSGRSLVPSIDPPMGFCAWLTERVARGDQAVVLHTYGDSLRHYLTTHARSEDVWLAVGPEGGWSDREINAARSATGVAVVSLGPRVLRTETAALVAISQIRYHFDLE